MKAFEIFKKEFLLENIQSSIQKLIILVIGILTALDIAAIMFF